MTDTYRAMCAELANAYEHELNKRGMGCDLIDRARALLAQPVADEETEEAAKLIHASMRFAVPLSHSTCDWVERGNSLMQDEARRTARAVLAKWGRPMPQPVAERLRAEADQ